MYRGDQTQRVVQQELWRKLHSINTFINILQASEIAEYMESRQKVHRPLTVSCSLEMMYGEIGEGKRATVIFKTSFSDAAMPLHHSLVRPEDIRYQQRRIEEDAVLPILPAPRKRAPPRRRIFNCFAPSRSP